MLKETNKPVLILPSDQNACGSYRLIWPAQACMNAGKPVLVQNRMPKIQIDSQGNVQGINVGNYEVIVMQRPGSYQMPQVIEILQDNGVKVVLDIDDSMSKIDPRNPTFKHYDPRTNPRRNWMHVAKSCEMADLVTCTTEALAEEYGSHGRVKIIKNHVPKRYLDIPRPDNKIPIVTWGGWTLIHPGDLSVCHNSITQVLAETGASFMAFGDLEIFTQLGIQHRPPNIYHGFVGLHEYPEVLAKADIGIVPLTMSEFNKSKSFLKMLELSACGVIPVASGTPDNRLFAELGGGIIAETPAAWLREIKELILDNDKRAEMGKQVREAAAQFIIEENWGQWFDAWQNA